MIQALIKSISVSNSNIYEYFNFYIALTHSSLVGFCRKYTKNSTQFQKTLISSQIGRKVKAKASPLISR